MLERARISADWLQALQCRTRIGEEANLFQEGASDMHTESGTLDSADAKSVAANWMWRV